MQLNPDIKMVRRSKRLVFIFGVCTALSGAAQAEVKPFDKLERVQVNELEFEGSEDRRDIVVGLRETVLTGLDRSSGFQIVSEADQSLALQQIKEREKAGDIIADKDAAVAAILRADYICKGKVTYGKSVVVEMQILKMPEKTIFKTIKYEGDPADRFSLQDAFFKRIYNALTNSPDETEIAISNLAGTTRYSAYRFFSEAIRKWDKDPLAAISLCDEAIKEDPMFASPWRLKGVIRYRKLNQLQPALADFQKFFPLRALADSESAFVSEMMGLIQSDRGNYGDALSHFDDALKIKSGKGGADAARLNIYAGYAILKSGDLAISAALDRFRIARSMLEQTGWQESHYAAMLANNEGTALHLLQKNVEALKAFEESRSIRSRLQLKLTSGYALATANAGLVLSESSDPASLTRATLYIEEAQKIRTLLAREGTMDYFRTQITLAAVHRKTHQINRAILALEPLASATKDTKFQSSEIGEFIELLSLLGNDYLDAKQFVPAERTLLRAISLLSKQGKTDSPEHAKLLESIVQAKLQSGRECDAIADMRYLYSMYADKFHNEEKANRMEGAILRVGPGCK